MSRIAKNPVTIPAGVQISISGNDVTVKGPKGSLERTIHEYVEIVQEDNELKFSARAGQKGAVAMSGTMRALVGNMVTGVSEGFEKKLNLVGHSRY